MALTQQDINELNVIRKYFAEKDRSPFGQHSFSVLDTIIKNNRPPKKYCHGEHDWQSVEPQYNGTLFICRVCGAED